MNSDIQLLKDAIATFAGDFATFANDLNTKLGTIVPADPADAQAIKDATTTLNEMDQKVKDLDAKVNS